MVNFTLLSVVLLLSLTFMLVVLPVVLPPLPPPPPFLMLTPVAIILLVLIAFVPLGFNATREGIVTLELVSQILYCRNFVVILNGKYRVPDLLEISLPMRFHVIRLTFTP